MMKSRSPSSLSRIQTLLWTLLLLLSLSSHRSTFAFVVVVVAPHKQNTGTTRRFSARDQDAVGHQPGATPSTSTTSSTTTRRDLLASSLSTTAIVATTASLLSILSTPSAAIADDTATAVLVEMKTFVDPQGLFVINIPKRFFALRRSAKGDLPDEKTGSGRRGSTIFTAGDMAKAELVSIEYFPTKVLLQDFGIDTSGIADDNTNLATISDIGQPAAVANLIALRRDKDKPGALTTKIIPNTVAVSPDGRELSFQLQTKIAVQKPELLLEQYGVSELFRITAAKASLQSNNGSLMAVFASALETDWKGGPDGAALQETVQSFRALDQSAGAATVAK